MASDDGDDISHAAKPTALNVIQICILNKRCTPAYIVGSTYLIEGNEYDMYFLRRLERRKEASYDRFPHVVLHSSGGSLNYLTQTSTAYKLGTILLYISKINK